MNLYIFASTALKNVALGIKHGWWAVAPAFREFAAARKTKAGRMLPGSAGLFYSSDVKAFAAPFVVASWPEENRVETKIWDEPWMLPFRIRPIGKLLPLVSLNDAKEKWDFVHNASNRGFLVSGMRAFVPVAVQRADWERMLREFRVELATFDKATLECCVYK